MIPSSIHIITNASNNATLVTVRAVGVRTIVVRGQARFMLRAGVRAICNDTEADRLG